MPEQFVHQPGSMLDIRPRFFPFSFLLYFFKPHFAINRGPDAIGQWKRNTVPVPPGRYEVAVWISYPLRPQMGLNTVVVDVPPGAAAVITWRAPFTIFGSGKMAVAGIEPLAGGSQQPHVEQPQHRQAQHRQAEQQFQPAQQAAQQAQPAAAPSGAPAGWHPDPARRHQLRYYDGSAWTEHVGDNGTQSRDPLG